MTTIIYVRLLNLTTLDAKKCKYSILHPALQPIEAKNNPSINKGVFGLNEMQKIAEYTM